MEQSTGDEQHGDAQRKAQNGADAREEQVQAKQDMTAATSAASSTEGRSGTSGAATATANTNATTIHTHPLVHPVDAELMNIIADGPFMEILSRPEWWKASSEGVGLIGFP
jgi:hypothetical protein